MSEFEEAKKKQWNKLKTVTKIRHWTEGADWAYEYLTSSETEPEKAYRELQAEIAELIKAHDYKVELLKVFQKLLDESANKIEELEVENAELKENQSWLIGALKNFHPFNGDLPEGLDPTMYQTLSYEGDKKLLDKFNEIKQTNEVQNEQ